MSTEGDEPVEAAGVDPHADVPGMTSEALRAEFMALAPDLTRIHNRRVALHNELMRREKAASVQNRVAAMSEDEKAALRAALGS